MGKKQTLNDAPFVALHDMCAVILSDEMLDMSIAGLLWFILYQESQHNIIDPHKVHFLQRLAKS